MFRFATPRSNYLAITCLLIIVGLLSRSHFIALPSGVAKYAGSIIWGAMVYFAIGFLLPVVRPIHKTLIASVIAAGTEFSQLIHNSWLDSFRATTIGVLLIGRFFSWWDIVCYLIGISVGATLDEFCSRSPKKL